MTARFAGWLLFSLTLIVDQFSKWLALEHLSGAGVIEVLPFFNLVLVWNTGVSFGMFRGLGEAGRWGLVGLAVIIGGVLLYMLWRETRLLSKLAFFLVLSGAAGNLIDRLRFGAVVDFLDFHVSGYHWPAFNVADSAIVIGAGLLIVDSIRRPATENAANPR